MERRSNLVFGGNSKLNVKKKDKVSLEDRQTWATYVKEMQDVYDKDSLLSKQISGSNNIKIIDLHGLSLENANKTIQKCIIDSFSKKYTKIKVITGKGLRSKSKNDPYKSNELSILQNSVPEFIKSNIELMDKIHRINPADSTEGGAGAFFILLKKIKE